MRVAFLTALIIVGVYVWNGWKPSPETPACSEPIAYAIGYFDRRFGISYQEFLKALAEAEAIWERPVVTEDQSTIQLFKYSPETAKLSINLIYDYRQEITETLSDISEVVKENETTYDAHYNQFKILKAQYDTDEAFYENLVNKFNDKNGEYESMVEEWNSGPRTSKAEFQKLEEKRTELQNGLAELRVVEANLNENGRQVNVLVERLNRLARSLNLNVEKFNTIGAVRGETFTGGLYVVSPTDERSIDIFEFKSREKLVRVLAHELGHALGLEHSDDSQAIMYYLNKGEAGALRTSDISALKTLCGIGS